MIRVPPNPKRVIQQTRGPVGSRDLVDWFLTPNHTGMFTLSQPSARMRRMNQQFEHLCVQDGFGQLSARMTGLGGLRAAVIDATRNLSPDLKC